MSSFSPDSSSVLQIMGALATLTAISVAVPKAFGPVSKAISKYFEGKRRAREEAEDVRITDLTEQNGYLKDNLRGARSDLEKVRLYDAEHVAWDYNTYNEIASTPGKQDWPQPPRMHKKETDGRSK